MGGPGSIGKDVSRAGAKQCAEAPGPAIRPKTHTFDLPECLVGLSRVDSGFISALSWPDSEPSVTREQAKAPPRGTRQLRQHRLSHHHAGHSLSN